VSEVLSTSPMTIAYCELGGLLGVVNNSRNLQLNHMISFWCSLKSLDMMPTAAVVWFDALSEPLSSCATNSLYSS
jgi:hypothetical protein